MSDTDRDLRLEAFKLIDEGWTSEEAAELLEIKKMTVAGWLSWRTRGHYVDEETNERERVVKVVRLALVK